MLLERTDYVFQALSLMWPIYSKDLEQNLIFYEKKIQGLMQRWYILFSVDAVNIGPRLLWNWIDTL